MYSTANSAFPDGHESLSAELPSFTCQESRSNSHPSLVRWMLNGGEKKGRVHRELGHVHFLSFEDTTWKMNIINQGGAQHFVNTAQNCHGQLEGGTLLLSKRTLTTMSPGNNTLPHSFYSHHFMKMSASVCPVDSSTTQNGRNKP